MKLLRRLFSFRVLVIASLLLIWLELGGGDRVSDWYRHAVYEVKSYGKPQEGPAPYLPGQRSGGLDDAYQAGTDAVLLDMVQRGAQPASAPASR